MANNNSDTGFLYFLVGILFVAALGIGYAFYTGGVPATTATGNTLVIEKTVTETVPAPGADQTAPANQMAPATGTGAQ